MNLDSPQVSLSAIDEERFGIRTARASNVTVDGLSAVMDFCKANRVVLLISRCLISETKAAQAMERYGFLLMDTLVYYERDLVKKPIPTDTGRSLVRPIMRGEEDDVKKIAEEAFRGYFGHYHADSRLDRAKCDEAYISWATRSCVSREIADEVLIADLNGATVGFVTLRFSSPKEGEVALVGVSPAAQGLGISPSLMIHAMHWFRSKEATRLVISTQIINIAAQKVWTRIGFEFSHAYYTFHKWFDAP
jgi:ribosomal protein S18 acetylase RimI-like enzyme